MNVEITDIEWIINKCKKAKRYSPVNCRISGSQRFSLAQCGILQHDAGNNIEDVQRPVYFHNCRLPRQITILLGFNAKAALLDLSDYVRPAVKTTGKI